MKLVRLSLADENVTLYNKYLMIDYTTIYKISNSFKKNKLGIVEAIV